MKKASILLAVLFTFIFVQAAPLSAAPPTQTGGQEYIVQAGDWLSKIAQKFYGDPQQYQKIVDATNEKAKTDSSFAVITDPNKIEVGQKLWIPEAGAPLTTVTPPSDAELTAAFKAAAKDAEVAEASEISRNLIAIVPSEPELKWQGDGADKRVLVVTWTSFNGYDANVGKNMTLTRQVFVTAVPQVQDFCKTDGTTGDATVLRLEQLLGLPPHNGKNRFVEMWVKPIDLFRPSPDPEITDHEAELDFRNSKQETTSDAYIAWFNDLKSKSYGDNGYPWTRLGYTYDWGNPKSHVGMSEFVIDTGADIIVQDVTSNDKYCP